MVPGTHVCGYRDFFYVTSMNALKRIVTDFLGLANGPAEEEHKSDRELVSEFVKSTVSLLDRYINTVTVLLAQEVASPESKDKMNTLRRKTVSQLVAAVNPVVEQYLASSPRELDSSCTVDGNVDNVIAAVRPAVYAILSAFAVEGIDAFDSADVALSIGTLNFVRAYLTARLGEGSI